jgi:hypothetical protein
MCNTSLDVKVRYPASPTPSKASPVLSVPDMHEMVPACHLRSPGCIDVTQKLIQSRLLLEDLINVDFLHFLRYHLGQEKQLQ